MYLEPSQTTMNYKTTKYLRMKGVLDSIELRMLRRADYLRECNISGESHVCSYETLSVFHIGWEIGWEDSLFSLAFATRWNPKHPSYVSTHLICNSNRGIFLAKFAKVLRTPFFIEHLRWLLLICLLFKFQSFKDLIVQFQLLLLLSLLFLFYLKKPLHEL